MTYEQDNSLTAYRIGAIALGVAIVVVTICGSLGLVWMRQQVSGAATSTSRLQAQIAEAERFSAGLEARLARALSPQFLSSRLPQGLRPSASEQIVWSARPQALSPVAGFGDGTMIASASGTGQGGAVSGASAGTVVAARQVGAAAGSPLAQVSGVTAPAATVASTRGAAPVARLVETPQAARAASGGATSVSVTFDVASLSGPAQPGAPARR